MADAEWRRIDSLVRPQRFALLINKTDYWQYTIQRAIETFTQLWGGAGFIIIPTDGDTISEKFWDILENYSPDYLGCYKTTLRDLKWANREEYVAYTDNMRIQWMSQGLSLDDANKAISEHDIQIYINELKISDRLNQELLDRLSPFHFSMSVERHHVYVGLVLDYPFTQLKNILGNSKIKPTLVYKQKELAEPVFNLMAKMRSGSINEQFEADLEASGIDISDVLMDLTDKDYLNLIEKGEVDRLSHLIDANNVVIPEDVLLRLPNSLPMNGLGKYFRIEPGRKESSYVTVVVGDNLEDFCFAFSLSKILNNVHWMPDRQLLEAYRDTERIKFAMENGDESKTLSENTQIVRSLASTYVHKIGYGFHNDRKIILTSVTLSKTRLVSRRRKMLSLAYAVVENLLDSVIIRCSSEIDVDYIGRLLETNSWANEQAIAFVDNEGVERIRPVRPKHFNHIDAQNHRWIQTVQVSGFHPPVLPALGNEILKNKASRHEGRVGKDGISFLLPGISFFFGNDIDTTLQSPELKILTSIDIFSQYFAGKYLVAPSDKGRFFNDTVEKFGGIDEAAKFFGNKKYSKFLWQFTEEKRKDEKNRRGERIYLDYTSRAYLDINRIRKALGNSGNASNLIDYLLSIRILRRGLILHCKKCSCSAWYDNDIIGQDFECARCRTKQMILKESWKNPEEPSWYYSMAETTYQFYQNDGHITLLALRHIKGDSKDFQYLPEMELHDISGNGKKFEIDIACVRNGYIYLGEAKNRKILTSDLGKKGDLYKYLRLYSDTQPKPYRIVLATNHGVVPSTVRSRLKLSLNSNVMYVLRKDLYKD